MEAVAAALNNEYEKAKQTLKGVDENIIKLYGRDPLEKNSRPQRRVFRSSGNAAGHGGQAAGRLFGEARRILNNPNREPIGGPGSVEKGRHLVRRVSQDGPVRPGSIQSRLGPKRRRAADSGDEDDQLPTKLAVQSVFVPTVVEVPKREDSLAMKTDRKGMARNRRMFGALLGTLQSFQKTTKKDEDREKRRAEVEKKLEEKQRDEQFKLRREKAALWNERREKQRELRQLETKMKLVRAFEEWEKVIRDQANFIRTTKGKHQIYYMPRRMLPANERALEDTEDYIEALVKERRKKLQEEIDRIMSAPFRNRQRSNNDRGNAEQTETPADKSDHSGSDSEDSNDEIEEGEVSVAEPSEQQDVPMEMQAIKVKREEAVVVKHEVLEEGKGDEGSEGDNQSQQVSHGLGDEIPVSDDELDESSTSQQLTQQSLASAPSQQESSGKSKVHSNTQEEGKSGGRGRNANSASKSRSRSPKRKVGKKNKDGSSSAGSASDSGSASGTDSGSTSGSESEPEAKE